MHGEGDNFPDRQTRPRAPTLTPEEIARLGQFLAKTLHAETCRVINVASIPGGTSREMFRFDAVTPTQMLGLILRRDPASGMIETERRIEFAALRSFHDSSCVPVPRPIALCEDTDVLGRPFMVIRRIDNARVSPAFTPDPYGAHRERIGQGFFRILGAIHAADAGTSDLAATVKAPLPRACWSRELDHWEGVIEANALEPQPIAMAAIRRLRRHAPPAPRRLAIVHGDYRIGNFLHDGAGSISAILDWEMAHIGDCHEDLAWALDPLWAGQNGLAAGMIEFESAIGVWSEASGREFDAQAFAWWSLFSAVKGVAIWLSCARRFNDDKGAEPILAFSGWYCLQKHNKAIADRLAAAPRGALA
jgi:aminoglycoside phosphotransferase (APT) family kinase protein